MDIKIKNRSDIIELLDIYSRFLLKNGYIDTDYKDEEPFAIDTFMEEYKNLAKSIPRLTAKEIWELSKKHKISDAEYKAMLINNGIIIEKDSKWEDYRCHARHEEFMACSGTPFGNNNKCKTCKEYKDSEDKKDEFLANPKKATTK